MLIVQISLQFGTRPSSWKSRDIPVAPSSSHSVPRISTVARGIQCWTLQSGEKSPHSCRPSREIKWIKGDIKWSPEVEGSSYPYNPVIVKYRHRLCHCTLLLPTEDSYSVVVLSDYHTDWNTDKLWFKIHSKYIFIFSRVYRKAVGPTQSPSWSAWSAASPELKAAEALGLLLECEMKNEWEYTYRGADKSLARPGRK
jgi:hypothetical protein